jgi:5-methylcytosine-specific restriction enzyme A
MARTQGHGNPNWTRDEVVLALDLYFDLEGQIPSHDDERVQELSTLLRRFPYHAIASRKPSFRNPDGVAFKLQNLRQVATGEGLSNVSETDRRVWHELGADPNLTRQLAERIRAAAVAWEDLPEGNESEPEFLEGRLITELHRRRERDARLRQRLLAARRRNGILTCEMCSTSSTSDRSELEDAIFEAHHVVLLSRLGEHTTRLKDVALLCANCHRLLHRAISVEKRWLSIDEASALCGVLRR